MNAYPITSLVLAAIVLMQFWFAFQVGRERTRSKIKAPAMVGDNRLECALRVQGNTVEQFVMFLPALLIAMPLLGDIYSAVLALLWMVGRVLFAQGYMRDPSARGTGFIITVGALAIAVICGIVAAVRNLILLG
ncbi:MAG: MAPEG family protein [Xanthomonadales bacterium]|nr:MAPEG family protein [Xanthomonadales bacterium]